MHNSCVFKRNCFKYIIHTRMGPVFVKNQKKPRNLCASMFACGVYGKHLNMLLL
jgi:hypothetical protein